VLLALRRCHSSQLAPDCPAPTLATTTTPTTTTTTTTTPTTTTTTTATTTTTTPTHHHHHTHTHTRQATKIIYVISWVHLDGVDAGDSKALRAAYDDGRARVAHLCDLVSSERVPSLPPGKISMALAQRPSSPGRCGRGPAGARQAAPRACCRLGPRGPELAAGPRGGCWPLERPCSQAPLLRCQPARPGGQPCAPGLLLTPACLPPHPAPLQLQHD
jgi:hypothetical protein